MKVTTPNARSAAGPESLGDTPKASLPGQADRNRQQVERTCAAEIGTRLLSFTAGVVPLRTCQGGR